MRRTLVNLGARGLLKALGGLATLAVTACPDYGVPHGHPDTAYGPPLVGADAAYGPRACTADTDCGGDGSQWYCGPSGWCEPGARPDAGTPEDAGQ